MRVLNRIVLIFILLAAAGAAVLSYFLYEKRTQMLQGWEMMAKEINATAQELDRGSGTKLADSLKQEELTHRQLDEMERKLKELSEGAKKLIAQRDALARTVCDIAAAVEVRSGDPAKLTSVETYEAHRTDLLQKVRGIHARNQAILVNFINAGKTVGVSGSEQAIKGDRGGAFLAQIRAAVQKKNARISTYEASLSRIGSTVGTRFQQTETQYKPSSSSVNQGVARQKSQLDTTTRNLNAANSRIQTLLNEKAALNTKITGLNGVIAKKNAEIKDLLYKLNPSGNADIDRILHGPKDREFYCNLYSLIKATVRKVDHKWNFVVLDLGTKKTVSQTIEGKTFNTILDIPANVTMTIVRDLDSGSPKIVGKITLKEVHGDHSIADVQADLRSKIKEGDVVIFLKDDMDLLFKGFKFESAK